MLDKLDLEYPFRVAFNPGFKRLWDSAESDDLLKKKRTKLYDVVADLRPIGVSAMLSLGHKHHKRLGPKVEIIDAGRMHYSEWADTGSQIFSGEPYEAAILRADCTTDVRDVSVPELGRQITCKFKAITRQEYGEEPLVSTLQRYAAQTLYYGKKPRQFRIYDKTLHRKLVLLAAIHRQQRRRGERLSTFFEEYGYDPREVVTRIERQMGAREPGEAWGIVKFGDIQRFAKCDPFERLRFVTDARGGTQRLSDLDGTRRMLIKYIREHVDRDGIDRARAWSRAEFDRADSYRKFWRENEHLIIETSPMVSRERLTAEFHRTITAQLAA